MVIVQNVLRFIAQLFSFFSQMMGSFFPALVRRRKLRPWMTVRKGKSRAGGQELVATDEDISRLLQRMEQLQDTSQLSKRAVGFTGQGSDFFADPAVITRLVGALLHANPPFLHLARTRPDEGEGTAGNVQTEYLLRESEVITTEPYTLFIPQLKVEHMESRRPPGMPVPRVARTLADLRSASLLYQTLPEDLLIARLVEGSIPIMAYRSERKHFIFKQEDRLYTRREKRITRVPVEIETGGEGQTSRLMYLLFDRSTSLVRNCTPRGSFAVMQLAVALTMVRMDLGKPHARYYYRAFAERLDPLAIDPPIIAKTVKEKDHLAERLMSTNFSGEATNVMDALTTAADDIEKIIQSGELGEGVRPRVCLMTDGRATIYRSIGVRLKSLGIELDTVLIGQEASHNPELISLSTTVSLVDPSIWRG